MLKKIRYLFVVFAIFMFIPSSVFAAKYTGSSGTKIYYSGGQYTYYNKTIDNNIAYCAQLGKSIPSVGHVYTASDWNRYSTKALIAGQIIKYGKEIYKGQNEYLFIQYALNCYFKYNGYFGCGDTANKIINKAKARVAKYNYVSGSSTAPLPAVSITAENNYTNLENIGGQNYVSKKITISGMRTDKFGGDDSGAGYTSEVPQYSLSVSSTVAGTDVAICPGPTYNNGAGCGPSTVLSGKSSYSFYIHVFNGNLNGGGAVVSVSGRNSSHYPSADRWLPKVSSHQKMFTYVNSIPVTRSTAASLLLTYPKTNLYSASLIKIDENGASLEGASLNLYIASDRKGENKIKDVCSIAPSGADGTNSCAKNDLKASDGYVTGNFLCYSEGNEPSGYKKIATKCEPIQISGDPITRYYIQQDDGTHIELTPAEYAKYGEGTNIAKNYCITNTENNFDDSYVNSVISNGLTNNDKLSVGSCVVDEETLGAAGEDDNTNTGGESGGSGSSGGSETSSSYSKTICIAGDGTYDSSGKYCAKNAVLSSFAQTNGNMNVKAVNALNVVNISKKAIAGSDEIPGAKLSIYTTDNDGNCTKNLAKAKRFDYKPFVIDNSASDDNQGTEQSGDGTQGGQSGNDDQSGQSGNDEQGGQSSGGNQGEQSSTSEENQAVSVTDALTWESSYAPAIISGLNPGTYCLVEELAPVGYKRVTNNIKFSMDSNGVVKLVDKGSGVAELSEDKVTEDSTSSTSTITIRDEIIDVTVSKTSAATSKELPGATLSICEASKNEYDKYALSVGNAGDCTVVTLADGTPATWVSTNEPHIVHGLGSGAYYLVETIAPNGYSTAESIFFIVKEDGTLTDKDGKSLANSKLVMHDKLIKDSKTGMLGIFVIMAVFVVSCVAGVYSYLNLKKNNVNNV